MTERDTASSTTAADARVAALEAALAAANARLERVTKERDQLRASHERLRLELELLRRRIFVAKAERVDTAQLELEFADKMRALETIAGTLGLPDDDGESAPDSSESKPAGKPKQKQRSTGRRDLRRLDLEEERVELSDPVYEALVAEGKAKRIGFEESCRAAWKRGGLRRLVIARAKYQVVAKDGETTVDTTEMPAETFPRSLAAPSLLAHVLFEKYGKGVPFFRLEDEFARNGGPIDRGTMCRWSEEAGGTAGSTVIAAARKDAFAKAFCIATDATGVAVQPIPTNEKARQSCRRGHFFVHVADRDHVFLEYVPKETSAAVSAMFKGYSGYLQADAKSVYDVLYRDPEKPPDDEHPIDVRVEVACWSHLRRKFWETASAKNAVAREGLFRVGRIFELDASWRGKAPAQIKVLREQHLRPHVDAFFSWVTTEHEKVRHERGMLRSALGYAVRQEVALKRFLEDGRLVLDNNRSERALRPVAVGRKAWLFVGSDDHGESTGHLFSLIASARLHGLDPEAYLRDLFRVLGHWPRDRYVELAAKYWTTTRARLDPAELAMEIGPLTIPAPATAVAEEQSSANGSSSGPVRRRRRRWRTRGHVASMRSSARLRETGLVQRIQLLSGFVNAYIAGDSAYSSRALVEQLEEQGCQVVIPLNPTHASARRIDKHLYKERRLVENFFQRIKRCRRIAMRFEKLARNFLGFLYLAAALVWLF